MGMGQDYDYDYERPEKGNLKGAKDMKSTIEAITLSKTKKSWRVMVLGKWYGAKFDTGIQEGDVGATIEAKIVDTDDFGEWIEDVKILKPAPPATDIRSPKINGDRWYMPFVSNTVNGALRGGQITKPSEISQWAKAAHDAAIALGALDEPGTQG